MILIKFTDNKKNAVIRGDLVETPVCNAPILRDPKVDCTQLHIRA